MYLGLIAAVAMCGLRRQVVKVSCRRSHPGKPVGGEDMAVTVHGILLIALVAMPIAPFNGA